MSTICRRCWQRLVPVLQFRLRHQATHHGATLCEAHAAGAAAVRGGFLVTQGEAGAGGSTGEVEIFILIFYRYEDIL